MATDFMRWVFAKWWHLYANWITFWHYFWIGTQRQLNEARFKQHQHFSPVKPFGYDGWKLTSPIECGDCGKQLKSHAPIEAS